MLKNNWTVDMAKLYYNSYNNDECKQYLYRCNVDIVRFMLTTPIKINGSSLFDIFQENNYEILDLLPPLNIYRLADTLGMIKYAIKRDIILLDSWYLNAKDNVEILDYLLLYGKPGNIFDNTNPSMVVLKWLNNNDLLTPITKMIYDYLFTSDIVINGDNDYQILFNYACRYKILDLIKRTMSYVKYDNVYVNNFEIMCELYQDKKN